MHLLSWKLLLANCILFPVSAILFDIVMKPIQAHARKEMTALAEANAVTQDAIRGILITEKDMDMIRILPCSLNPTKTGALDGCCSSGRRPGPKKKGLIAKLCTSLLKINGRDRYIKIWFPARYHSIH
jgi:hypothetical protein